MNAQAPSIVVVGAQSNVQLSNSTTPRLSRRTAGVPDFQRSLFDAVIDAQFHDMSTVGEAFSALANFVGYDFVVAGVTVDPMAKTFFARPLSDLHRNFGHASVRDALVALAGNGYTVVVDHAERSLSVDVRPAHRVMSRLESEIR